MTRLYYVHAQAETDYSDSDPLNLDLIVETDDPSTIVALWTKHYSGGFEEDYLDAALPNLQIWQVPERTGKPTVFNWHTDVPPVDPNL